ncbi:DUF6896 domain-containing protein [Flavobacterium sp. P21]|uniref:DUF6896 domain-containing protein n=1 Tax=Flavobacterium sp. P21 TaxID=3423948 RepID=UPI003D67F255
MIKNWFKNFFNTTKVDSNIIKQAIIDYRIQGKYLMFELGKKFDLDIKKIDDYKQLISRSNENIPRKGKLSERWNYCFHGGECRFYNKKHQQTVEVVLCNSPEFGHINAWFLWSFMQSTEKYKNEAKNIEWQELKVMINKLYKSGQIKNIE